MTSTSAFPTSKPLQSEQHQAIVFTIAGHYLALPLTAVIKVIPSPLNQPTSDLRSLLYLHDRPITLLNLRTSLPSIVETSEQISTPGQFLLIARLQDQLLWAIPVDESPTVMNLPLSAARLLPPDYQQFIHYIASHVVMLTQPENPKSILLLNLKQAANAVKFSTKTLG